MMREVGEYRNSRNRSLKLRCAEKHLDTHKTLSLAVDLLLEQKFEAAV